LRGRRLDKAKIERWRKREGMVGGSKMGLENSLGESHYYTLFMRLLMGSEGLVERASGLRDGGHSTTTQMELCQKVGRVEEMSCHQEQREETRVYQVTFNPWLAVDVVGSPGLTGLIGALTLDLLEDIPDLDLLMYNSEESEDESSLKTPDEICGIAVFSKVQNSPLLFKPAPDSVTVRIMPLSKHSAKPRQHYMPGPLDELYPFPRSASQGRIFMESVKTDHLLSSDSMKMKELECRMKFKLLHNMERSAQVDLINDMRSIAWRHYELEQPGLSEQWWRRVITTSLNIPGYNPSYILRACLWVVDTLRWQCKPKEAFRLHATIHSKILKLVGPDHQLSMLSKEILGLIFRDNGDCKSLLAISRELLQVCLYRFGTRNCDTLEIMHLLAQVLISCGQHEEAQAIVNIHQELDCELSGHTDRTETDNHNSFRLMTQWAYTLFSRQRYKDGANVLVLTERRFSSLMRIEYRPYRNCLRTKATALKLEGKPLESEDLLRTLLTYHDLDICDTMSDLADLLRENGRYEEAISFCEKAFRDEVEVFGIEHKFTWYKCWNLGLCYAHQGRFNDAIIHFQQTKEKVALSQEGDHAFRAEYIEDIQGWIWDVEDMRKTF
jgi:tetratricopeptide (TPR) repeat protein